MFIFMNDRLTLWSTLRPVEKGTGQGKLLLTGATGFVGTNLQEELRRRGMPFFATSKEACDLACREQAVALFREHVDAEVILHLADLNGAAEFPARHATELLDVNSRIHLNVLDAWHRFLPHARLIAIGSSCAYPAREGGQREEDLLDGPVHGSLYAYALTKRLLAEAIRTYGDVHGLKGTYLIPSTMFGEHDDFHVETAHVSGALIGKIVSATVEGRPSVEIWGDGTQVRDFMDVREFVSALLHLLPRCERDRINIGPGKGTTVRELAETIRRAAGFEGQLVFQPSAYVGASEKWLDVSKLERDYGYRIQPDLAEGISRTVAWYRANHERLKNKRKFATSP